MIEIVERNHSPIICDPLQKTGSVLKGEGRAVLLFLRPPVEDELHTIVRLQSEGDAVVAVNAEARRIPFDTLCDVPRCGEDGLSHHFHLVFSAVFQLLQKLVYVQSQTCLMLAPVRQWETPSSTYYQSTRPTTLRPPGIFVGLCTAHLCDHTPGCFSPPSILKQCLYNVFVRSS